MIVLDTNVVSEVLRPRPDPQVVAWLRELNTETALTAMTVAELWVGRTRLPEGRRKRDLDRVLSDTIAPYRRMGLVLPFDAAAAIHYGEVVAMRERAGRPISPPDAEIVAICRLHESTCATRNIDDFAGTGIRIVNPWDGPAARNPT